jgi:hypothetical protein
MTDVQPKPKVLRGAFVEFVKPGSPGRDDPPPLRVTFQFNPMQLTRNRDLSFDFPDPAPRRRNRDMAGAVSDRHRRTLRQFHNRFTDLHDLQAQQLVTVQEQTIGLEIRLDATTFLDENDPNTRQFGIGPELATLELMACPRGETALAAARAANPTAEAGHSFTRASNPPLVLFIFGRKRVLPVNINSLNIIETDFDTDLNPIRATAGVNLTVIEGPNDKYLQTMTALVSQVKNAPVRGDIGLDIPG